MKYTFPLDSYGQKCVLVPIDAALVPLVSGAINKFLERYVWIDETNWQLGYNAFAEIMAAMTNNCLSELTEGQNRLYRLLDTALNGTQYAELPDGEISPAIPAAPPAAVTAANAGRAQLARLWQLAENAATAAAFENSAVAGGAPLDYDGSWTARLLAVQGTTPAGWFGLEQVPVKLVDLLKAGRVNNTDDKNKIKGAIDQVDSALDVGTDLGTFIKSFLDSAAELGTDGGLIAVQLATAAATNRALQRIFRALDGGEIIVPSNADNNLLSLARKTAMNDAGTKNSGQLLADILDALGSVAPDPQVVTLLTEISARIGPQVAGNGANAQLASMLAALRSIAGLEAAGTIAAGSALRLQLDILECICEAVSGPPTAVTWPPPPEAPCGEFYPIPVLRATILSFTRDEDLNQWVGTFDNWETVDAIDGVTHVPTPAGSLVTVAGSGTRQLCITYQWPEGVNDYPAGTLEGIFAPYLVNGSRDAVRPVINYGGSAGETEEFYATENGTELAIGYNLFNVSGPPGVEITSPVRIYIFAGAFG